MYTYYMIFKLGVLSWLLVVVLFAPHLVNVFFQIGQSIINLFNLRTHKAAHR